MEPKGLLVGIYRDVRNCDCTNGGVSAKAKAAVLVGNGMPEIFKETESTPLLDLVKFDPFRDGSRVFFIAVPHGKEPGMFGGNFVYTSDSRFWFDYPIKIYDRYE